ncbi:MAG: hypothetical protein OXC06_15340 [Acidimicrobiaceae bacterium]|nr:hypothetical protein [Acidimicrobiaceae bacterium]
MSDSTGTHHQRFRAKSWLALVAAATAAAVAVPWYRRSHRAV